MNDARNKRIQTPSTTDITTEAHDITIRITMMTIIDPSDLAIQELMRIQKVDIGIEVRSHQIEGIATRPMTGLRGDIDIETMMPQKLLIDIGTADRAEMRTILKEYNLQDRI